MFFKLAKSSEITGFDPSLVLKAVQKHRWENLQKACLCRMPKKRTGKHDFTQYRMIEVVIVIFPVNQFRDCGKHGSSNAKDVEPLDGQEDQAKQYRKSFPDRSCSM